VQETVRSRPGVDAFRTLVFYRGDEGKQLQLWPAVAREIDRFLAWEQESLRGRGPVATGAGERGRAVFDASAPADAPPVLYQFVLGIVPNNGPGRSAPYVCETLHVWPGAEPRLPGEARPQVWSGSEPLVRRTDHLGRTVGESLPGSLGAVREVAAAGVSFDPTRFAFAARQTAVVEIKPPGYVSADPSRPHPTGRLVPSQQSTSLG
jgi:hypothetical protein